jgi:predicted RND superfamily exporter protein
MRPSEFIARIVTGRRPLVWLGVAFLAVMCLTILVTRISLDSDVLNMLPGNFDTVRGLKTYNRDFEQTRELTFALQCDPADVDALEDFASKFAEELPKQPWAVRVLTGSPMETPEGIRDLQGIAVPLLLNLEPRAFDHTISILAPDRVRERLHRLHEQIEAGSPRPQFELDFDPLGVLGSALGPFAESSAMQEEQPLTSSDRTMRIFLVVTNQPSISAFECQRLMRQVNAFRSHATDGWTGKPLQLLITGRSAYVAEISLSMRYDIVATLLGSILLVSIIFFSGFKRWLPLFGMGFSLLLSCLVALASGLLIFHRLNMVTVGFCAILVGLGVDFAILTFGRYQQARGDGESHLQAVTTAIAKLGRAVFFGALTTAVGFLALVLSGSIGFIELGVLIAIGILFAGFFMCTILFLFVREEQAPLRHDWIFEGVKKYVRWSVQRPRTILIISILSLGILTIYGFSPYPRLPFDSSARSLEPKNSRAGLALAAIMEKMPTRWEPVLAIVHASNPQELHDDWQRIAAHWADLQRDGQIKSFSTPAALAFSPAWTEQNRERLKQVDFAAGREALEQAIDAEGFNRDSFASAFHLLDELKSAANKPGLIPNWRQQLPKSSAWWFLIDRYFGIDPLLTSGFVTTNGPIASHAEYENLSRLLPVPGVPITFSGWSYTLANLLPWAKHQLLIISAMMALFDALLLAVLYRDWRLWLIQEITLVCGVGAMLATMKLLNVPLNLLNVLAFRLVLAIGVDYGIYVLLVWQKAKQLEHDVAGVMKPVLLAGLTAVCGFGSLGLARNPSLSGLGIACSIGIFWTLVATIFFTLPAAAAAEPKLWREDKKERSHDLVTDD